MRNLNTMLARDLRFVRAERETGRGSGVTFYSTRTKNVLLLKRSTEGDCPLTWCCPGGGTEPHESSQQGALRELREEIGWRSHQDLLALYKIHESDPEGQTAFNYTNFVGVVRNEFRPALNNEHMSWQWICPVQALRTLDLLEAYVPALKRIIYMAAKGVFA